MKYLSKLLLLFFTLILTSCTLIEVDETNESSKPNESETENTYYWGYTKESFDILNEEFKDSKNFYYAMDWLGREPIGIGIKKLNDEVFNIYDLQGSKFVIDIMRIDCDSCKEIAPIIVNQLENSDIKLISIFYSNDSADEILDFYKNLNLTVNDKDIILKSSRENSLGFIQSYKIESIPTLIFVDENFKISNIHIGEISEEDLKSKLKVAFENEVKLYNLEKELLLD